MFFLIEILVEKYIFDHDAVFQYLDLLQRIEKGFPSYFLDGHSGACYRMLAGKHFISRQKTWSSGPGQSQLALPKL